MRQPITATATVTPTIADLVDQFVDGGDIDEAAILTGIAEEFAKWERCDSDAQLCHLAARLQHGGSAHRWLQRLLWFIEPEAR